MRIESKYCIISMSNTPVGISFLAIDIIHKNRGIALFKSNAPEIKAILGLYMVKHDTMYCHGKIDK